MLNRNQSPSGRFLTFGRRAGPLVFSLTVLVLSGQRGLAANIGPQAYFFQAKYGVLSDTPEKVARWNAALGAPISGVFIYDNRANPTVTPPVPDTGYVDVTGTSGTYGGDYSIPAFGDYEKDYLTPSQTRVPLPGSPDADMDGVPDDNIFDRGLSGFNYVLSNGYTFRRRLDYPSPLKIRVVNDEPNVFGTPADAYWVTDNMKLEATGDTGQGRTIDLFLVSGPLSLTSLDVLSSLDLADFQPIDAPFGWQILNDGNAAQILPGDAAVPGILRAIPFGDTNGSGKVTSGDFAALLANYLKPEGTYGGEVNHPVGAAIWTDGDFNVDGVVNHDDYKMFVDPGSVVAGLPRNFLEGDVNFDGIVNIFDINAVSSNWGGTTSPMGDGNLDGAIDIFDINLISANWNAMGFGPGGAAEGSGASVVPEPGSLLLLAIAGGGLGLACVARSRNRGGRWLSITGPVAMACVARSRNRGVG
jgi:hypothetical protein